MAPEFILDLIWHHNCLDSSEYFVCVYTRVRAYALERVGSLLLYGFWELNLAGSAFSY